MIPSELVGNLLAAGLEAAEAGPGLDAALDTLQPGAVILMGRNVLDGPSLEGLIRRIRSHRLPDESRPLVLVDHEGGLVHRFGGLLRRAPSAMALGAANRPDLARRLGRAVGAELRQWGIDSPLAPVLDRAAPPENPQLLTRTLGDDPIRGIELARAWAEGLAEGGAAPGGKHFPGLGSARVDTHHAPAEIRRRGEEEEADLLPFRRLAPELPVMLTSHALYPELDPTRPATHSPVILQELLRKTLGFQGLLLSDDLSMGALTARFDPGEAAVRALGAGCDLALLCRPEEAFPAREALRRAMESGRLRPGLVSEALRRRRELLTALDRWEPSLRAEPVAPVAAELARAALTRLDGPDPIPPACLSWELLDLTSPAGSPVAQEPPFFARKLAERLAARLIRPGAPPDPSRDLLILLGSRPPDADGWPPEPAQPEGGRRVLAALGVPPPPETLPRVDLYLATYSTDEASLDELVRILKQGGEAPGSLPFQRERG